MIRTWHRDGRGWTYLGMLLGGTISVYANVAEKYVENPHPALDGVLLAAAAPIAVWVMLEILIRVSGRSARAWAARLSATVVALVAFLTSYQHLHALLLARGESVLTARIYPLGIDGLLIGAGVVLWQIRAEAGQGKATAPEASAPGTPAPEAEVRADEPAPRARQKSGQEAGQVAAAKQGKPRATLQVTPEGSAATRQVTVQELEAAARTGQVRATSRAEVKAYFKIGSDRASELIKGYRERNELQSVSEASQS